MRIACVYWTTTSVGGIATHLNVLRSAAVAAGDRFDILHAQSTGGKTKTAAVFPERKWIRGGDTNIWVDGELPFHPVNVAASVKWLERNYDALLFGFICPHPNKAFLSSQREGKEHSYMPLFRSKLPKAAWVMDGYWDEYKDHALPLVKTLRAVFCPQESYAIPVRKSGVEVTISPFPFRPATGRNEPKTNHPSVLWPCQWKNIKGVTEFLGCVPNLPADFSVELYSNGIRYYQLRTEDVWKAAVGKDKFAGHDGHGRATFHGNVDHPEVVKAYQRAWFSANLQGMRTRKESYKAGSYNNTEVEALWYGACPVLHSSTKGTRMPDDLYLGVESADDIPDAMDGGRTFALSPERREAARSFVYKYHMAAARYQDIRRVLV